MKKLVLSLVVVCILIMTLVGGCVRSAAGESGGPAASSTACPAASLDDPQELERFLDGLIAEGMAEVHIPGAESKRIANLAFCATRV